MGYESRIIVVDVHRPKIINSPELDIYAEKICSFNMSCMRSSFLSIFTHKVDYSIYKDDGNTKIREDDYGDELRSASVDEVISYLRNLINSGEDYRRLSPVLGLLEGFNQLQWDHLEVVHYGY